MFTKIYDGVKKFIKENYIFILIIVIVNALFYIELPYVVESPGGSIILNDRIKVENGYEIEGQMGMAYVSVIRGSIPFLLASYIIPDWDIVAKDDMKYENETMDDLYERDRLYLQEAIGNATIAAFNKANVELTITKEVANISYIDKDADTTLKVGDTIISADGKDITSISDLREIVTNKSVGETIYFKVLRDDKEREEKAVIYETEDGLKAGVSIITTYEYDLSKEVEIEAKSSESGPSGGMMMALMIYNNLVKEDITKGRYIIGTGTIDKDGNVGAIGGVKYKLIGAHKSTDVRKKIFYLLKNSTQYMRAKSSTPGLSI